MPLRDFECPACQSVAERFYHATQETPVTCEACGGPLTALPVSDGVSRKTGIFPFVSTHFDGGKPVVVESLGHLRSLERHYGVLATAFSSDTGETPNDLPQHRPGGRAYEGLSLRQAYAERRATAIRNAVRAIETGKYRRPIVVR